MAKDSDIRRPKSKPSETSEEFDRFEATVRKLVSVPKRAIDEAVEREREARRNGNGSE